MNLFSRIRESGAAVFRLYSDDSRQSRDLAPFAINAARSAAVKPQGGVVIAVLQNGETATFPKARRAERAAREAELQARTADAMSRAARLLLGQAAQAGVHAEMAGRAHSRRAPPQGRDRACSQSRRRPIMCAQS